MDTKVRKEESTVFVQNIHINQEQTVILKWLLF